MSKLAGEQSVPISENSADAVVTASPITCGIVMPIADFAPYPSDHWFDVQGLIEEAIKLIGFTPRLVSSADTVGVIHRRIVENLYNDEIVVVDVSGRNPNVMFELGMRLAFDKPVVIIKDELTDYSFDTGNIEHLNYRSDLHYQSMVEFRSRLAEKIRFTYEAAKSGTGHASFLKSFGPFHPVSIPVVTGEDGTMRLVLEEIASLRTEIRRQSRPRSALSWATADVNVPKLTVTFPPEISVEQVENALKSIPMGMFAGWTTTRQMGVTVTEIELMSADARQKAAASIKNVIPEARVES